MIKKKYKREFLFILCLTPVCLLFFSNIELLFNGGIHATDFSIYQQAIYEIASGSSFNPYLTIRDLHIFNDHFDPVLILASPFVHLFNYAPETLLVFEFFWFLALIIVVWMLSENFKPNHRFFLLIGVIFSKGLLSGLSFPIHPSTWAMLPAFLISYFLCQKNKKGVLISGILICLFRESFPFAIISLSVTLMIFWKDWRGIGLTLFIYGVCFQVFNYILRPIWLGEIMNYSGQVINDSLFSRLIHNDYLPFIKVLYPFIPTIALILWKKKAKELFNDPLIQIVSFLAPLTAIHVITGKFHFQYGAQFAAPLLALIGFHPEFGISKIDIKIATAIALLSILSGMSIYTKAFNSLVLRKSNKCEISDENRENLMELEDFYHGLDYKSLDVLVTGGFAPLLMKPHSRLYQAGMFSKKLDHYDYAFISAPNKSDTYPFNTDLRKDFSNCEVVTENTSYTIYKNVNIDCMPQTLRPIEQE